MLKHYRDTVLRHGVVVGLGVKITFIKIFPSIINKHPMTKRFSHAFCQKSKKKKKESSGGNFSPRSCSAHISLFDDSEK